jgi:chromate transporter
MRLNRTALREVIVVFATLGATAFGGPAAHVALQERECVRRRRWLDHQRFLDLLAVTNLIPGPNSTEMAMHLGLLRAGGAGLVAGGVAFILPSAVLVTMLAAVYVRVGGLPSVEVVMATVRPAVVVVVADALVSFARQSIRDVGKALAALLALTAALGGIGELPIIALAVVVGLCSVRIDRSRELDASLVSLALVCLKIGATMFGSGYVLISYLRTELGGRGWLSDGAILDAVAIGQVTPGPVSTAATFVGYLLAGVPGAAVATIAIFLPAFVLVAATAPVLERWRAHPVVRRTLDVVNAAVVGLIGSVLVQLAPTALGSPAQIGIAIAAALGVWTLRIPASWVLMSCVGLGGGRAFLGW